MAGPRRSDELERGRASYAQSAWAAAYASFARADEAEPLSAPDLELFSISAYMLGREDEMLKILERAYQRHAADGEELPAARNAFWIGMNLALRGQMGPATGWLGRAQRIVDRAERECVEQGYMLMPVSFQHEMAGDLDGAAATAGAAVEIAERFGDADLFALALHVQGAVLVHDGRIAEGLALLDEAMVAAMSGELLPTVTGIVYCGVILACEEAYDVRRAQEWTAALTRWCERQPDLVAFTGRCRVHRARLMHLHGAWPEALEEARSAGGRFAAAVNQAAAAAARYLEGEVHRLRGELGPAEDAYRAASALGAEPQPGLALLRLAQGKRDAALGAIRRVVAESDDRLRRASLLPACVQILLASGYLSEARERCDELTAIADECRTDLLDAMAASARGAVELAEGDAVRAVATLRQAAQAWQTLDAPYETARVRVLIAEACRALGDDDAFGLELAAARDTFERLAAAPDVARVDSLAAGGSATAHGLTRRELEVLRLIAGGKSNRQIASTLVISEHTAARHVQNILAKLNVSSRSAAGAYAFEHDLV